MRIILLSAAVIIFTVGAFAGAQFVSEDVASRVRDKIERLWLTQLSDSFEVEWKPFRSGILNLDLATVPLANFKPGGGGGLGSAGGHVFFVDPLGRIGYFSLAGQIGYFNEVVPMNRAALMASDVLKNPRFELRFFRVQDLLATEKEPGLFDLLISHHRFADTCMELVISRLRVRETPGGFATVDSKWEELFKASPCIPFKEAGGLFQGDESGGRMVLLNEEELLFSVGDHEFDGHWVEHMAAMDPDSHLGKILILNLRSGVVSTFAMGFRNPQGLTLGADGRIWQTEHGPRGGDEVNLIVKDGNYGWPKVTYGLAYGKGGAPWPLNPRQSRHDGYTKPKFAFFPSIGISNLIEIRGEHFPFWKDDLLVASLGDAALHRLRLEDDVVVYVERLQIGERLRDLLQMESGRIAALTDSGNLLLIRNRDLEPPVRSFQVTRSGAASRENADVTVPEYSSDIEPGRAVFDARCGSCHALVERNNIGPHLVGLMTRRAGGLADYSYSAAFDQAEFRWDAKSLKRFLSEPETVVPANAMQPVDLNRKELDDLIDFLGTLN